MTTKHDCSKEVWRTTKWYPCSRLATVQRDGKWYCWQHDPERVEADKKKRRAICDAKIDRATIVYERRARNAKLAALVTPLPALLERLADEIPVLSKPMKWAGQLHPAGSEVVDNARALAARIREALEADNEVL